MDNIAAIKVSLSTSARTGYFVTPVVAGEAFNVIEALEMEVEKLKRELAEKCNAVERSVLGQVDNAIKAYRQETGVKPEVIIANVSAWDAMEKEAQRIAKPAPVNYATFRGIRVYKAEDGTVKPHIRLARDVATYDIE